ncbi:hypothetical protein BBP40_007323 [Aspergillus hancockii]|nr:hypothetical protein BBP40_007323 [Aspergillus hancockii]
MKSNAYSGGEQFDFLAEYEELVEQGQHHTEDYDANRTNFHSAKLEKVDENDEDTGRRYLLKDIEKKLKDTGSQGPAFLPTFENWPLCTAARQFSSAILQLSGEMTAETVPWTRALETFRSDDGPLISEISTNLCNHGELTDNGRAQMLALGKQLRQLYVDQLKLLPTILTDPRAVSFRSSPFPRALESLQHVIWGLFPPRTRAASFGSPVIVMRSPEEETLLPNEDFCERFIQLCKAYSRRTGDRWNKSTEMAYLNSLLRKYMPSQQPITTNSKPSVHAIHDIINATSATPDIRLPKEFYDTMVVDIVTKIAYEEEYGAYSESHEMREVGIGALLGDITERLAVSAENQTASETSQQKLFLASAHDSTLGAIMASLGMVSKKGTRNWPPYGSILVVELFHEVGLDGDRIMQQQSSSTPDIAPIARTQTSQLSNEQKARLNKHYVRIRYNGQSLVVPGCREPGRNWKGNETICTLAAFKEIVDRFTPKNWREACMKNLNEACFFDDVEPAGY